MDEKDNKWMDIIYLSNTKEPCLPHGFRSMVA